MADPGRSFGPGDGASILRRVADLPFSFTNAAIASQLARIVDVDGKIPRALAEVGALAGRDVVVLHADGDIRAAQLRAAGAHVTTSAADGRELVSACADVVVRCWAESGAVAVPDAAGLAAAERLLRPGGRLLIVADYGRDDVARLRPEGETPEIYHALRARDGAFVAQGFKLRVIHGWWTFDSLDHATAFLGEAFGERGLAVAASMRRPRLSHKVVVYHRGPGEAAETEGPESVPARRPGGRPAATRASAGSRPRPAAAPRGTVGTT